MKIFKGWFFYLVIAVLMVLVATISSNYYSLLGKEKPQEMSLLAQVPTIDSGLKKDWSIKKINISSSTGERLIKEGKEAAKKIANEAPERLQYTSGVKGIFFRYLSEKKVFLANQGFYFTEGADKKWDFGYQKTENKVRLFSIRP